jgi:heme exporter protein D
MIWNSWAEFFAMGGYGLYVWGSTAAVAFCMLAEIAGLRMRRSAAIEQARMAQKGSMRGLK